uniref:Uncharacterized protein n=1 Tax=Cyanoderma ruficeps TaxID=181631 RepID=A0A8C3X9T7_9PASS
MELSACSRQTRSWRKKSPPPSKVHPLTSPCSGEAWGAAAVGDSLSLSLPGCSLDCPGPGEISPRAGCAKGFGIMTPPGIPTDSTSQHPSTLLSPHCDHLYGASNYCLRDLEENEIIFL